MVTSGIVTVKDSAWLMSWTFNRQPHLQSPAQGAAGGLDLTASIPMRRGDYVGKAMEGVHGSRDLMEWL